jgi:hypothetical protein
MLAIFYALGMFVTDLVKSRSRLAIAPRNSPGSFALKSVAATGAGQCGKIRIREFDRLPESWETHTLRLQNNEWQNSWVFLIKDKGAPALVPVE